MNAGALYDSMEEGQKDMPREAFIRQVNELTDPKKFKKDLGGVMAKKQEFKTRAFLAAEKKKKIYRAIGG